MDEIETLTETLDPKDKYEPSEHALAIAELLKTVEKGDVIRYAALSAAARHETTGGKGRGYLRTARRILQRELGIVFVAVNCVGLRRVKDEDWVTLTRAGTIKTRRAAGRNLGKSLCMPAEEYTALPLDARAQLNLDRTLCHVVSRSLTQGSNRQLAEKCANGRLQVGQALDALRRVK